jgi:RNA polymerase sigma factor (sigma-70 family)
MPGASPESASDAVLLERLRDGDRDAFGVLYDRHAGGARRFAASLVGNPSDVDDVVSEVFAATLAAIEAGRGPTDSFAPYLFASIRNECRQADRRRLTVVDDVATARGDGRPASDPYRGIDEVAIVRRAFDSLPPHQRQVLWWTEVDGASPTELARQCGGTPHSVAVRAQRARRAFADAYLLQHLQVAQPQGVIDPACGEVRPLLARYVRGGVGVRARRRLDAHLAQCGACDEARGSLGRLNEHLRVLPVPPVGAEAPVGLSAFATATAQLGSTLSAWGMSVATASVAGIGALVFAAPPVDPATTDVIGPSTPPSSPAPPPDPEPVLATSSSVSVPSTVSIPTTPATVLPTLTVPTTLLPSVPTTVPAVDTLPDPSTTLLGSLPD